MQFTIDRNVASKAINLASKAIATRSPKPIMEMLLIEAKEGRVYFRGTNSILDITTWVEADVESDGAYCVNRLVGNMLPSFKPGEVTFKVAKMLVLRQGKSNNKFAVASPEEFPAKPRSASEFIAVDQEKFLRALEVTSIALSDRADMPVTQGFHINPHLNAISTADGDQVVYYDGIEMGGNISIPAGAYLESVLSELKLAEDLKVSIGSGWTGFRSDRWEIYVNEKQGAFPDLGSIVKQANDAKPSLILNVSVEEVKRLLSKAVVLSDAALASGRLHCLAIDRRDGVLSFQMTAQDIGSLDEVLEDAQAEGKDKYRILVHPRLLMEVLSVAKSDRLIFKLYRPTDPFVVVDPDESYQYIQVAMRLDREAEILNEESEPTPLPEVTVSKEEESDY